MCGFMGPCLGREYSGNSIPATPLPSVNCTASSTSQPLDPSVAMQSSPTRTTQYARYSVNDSHTLYPQASLISSRMSLFRPVQQNTTKSLEGRGPHSSCFSPVRMAHKGPDAMALKQVFNTVYFNLASCPTQKQQPSLLVLRMLLRDWLHSLHSAPVSHPLQTITPSPASHLMTNDSGSYSTHLSLHCRNVSTFE